MPPGRRAMRRPKQRVPRGSLGGPTHAQRTLLGLLVIRRDNHDHRLDLAARY
jgi:hypothetical protein